MEQHDFTLAVVIWLRSSVRLVEMQICSLSGLLLRKRLQFGSPEDAVGNCAWWKHTSLEWQWLAVWNKKKIHNCGWVEANERRTFRRFLKLVRHLQERVSTGWTQNHLSTDLRCRKTGAKPVSGAFVLLETISSAIVSFFCTWLVQYTFTSFQKIVKWNP